MKLWEKGYKLDQLIETYMTGDDPLLDHALISYDCLGSIAHAKMLEKIGILDAGECSQLTQELSAIIEAAENGQFTIRAEEEDVHTSIENALVKKLGSLGKKLHTARSRNDQVILDLRLYSKDWILHMMEQILHSCEVLCSFAQRYHAVPIPGRTHFQRAMPSSLGLWAGAFAESFLDNLELFKTAYWLIDQNPLGSAASYGVSIAIDRQYTSDLLGFREVQNNVLYANNSRGKFETIILSAMSQMMNDLSKICTDIIIFSSPEFGYITLPEKFCAGSSLMPQKRNPCPLELIRAKSATVNGMLFQVMEITRGLPSGYNRDFQETKRPLMQGFEVTSASIQVFSQVFSEIDVVQDKCLSAFSPELFATDKVLTLVKEGVPFRDAYKEVGMNPNVVESEDPIANILSKTHLGGTGNLGLEKSIFKIDEYREWIEGFKNKWEAHKQELLRKN